MMHLKDSATCSHCRHQNRAQQPHGEQAGSGLNAVSETHWGQCDDGKNSVEVIYSSEDDEDTAGRDRGAMNQESVLHGELT